MCRFRFRDRSSVDQMGACKGRSTLGRKGRGNKARFQAEDLQQDLHLGADIATKCGVDFLKDPRWSAVSKCFSRVAHYRSCLKGRESPGIGVNGERASGVLKLHGFQRAMVGEVDGGK